MAPRRSLAIAAVLAAALALPACGGGDDDGGAGKPAAAAGAEPAAVAIATRAAGPNRNATSGRIDGRVELRLTGVKAFAEPFAASVSGPFTYRSGAALPDYEVEMGVGDYGIGLTSLRGRSWVSLGSTAFALPGEIRRRLVRKAARGRNGLTRMLEQFGIAPWRWETEQRLAGSATIDGVAVQHITTSFNAGRIIRDANTLLGLLAALGVGRATGLPPRIPRSARKAVVAGVTRKRGASWIGVRDRVLRRSGFTMKFTIPARDRAKAGGVSGGTIVAELNVTEVGRPQRISAPATTGSFADFELGVDAVGDRRVAGG